MQASVGLALLNKARTLFDLGRFKEAEEVCDHVVARHGDAADPDLRVWVATALRFKGLCFEQRNRPDLARSVYEELAVRFPAHESAGIDEQLEMARDRVDRLARAQRKGAKRLAGAGGVVALAAALVHRIRR